MSSCVKYLMFFFNFLFWILGGLLVGVGLYAFVDKWVSSGGRVTVENAFDVLLNIALVMIIVGSVVFVVSFAGCIGALRENTCLLKFYSLCLLIFFLCEMGVAVVGFVFPHKAQGYVEEVLTESVIEKYRDDTDLQNLIDFVQQEFQCCGLSSKGYLDWSDNEYFNCTEDPSANPSVERCGVPFSCCINSTLHSSSLVNIMCGYGVQDKPLTEIARRVWTTGCVSAIMGWAERNLYVVAGAALGVALAQLLVIYLGRTLEGQIEMQRAQWS